MKNKDWDGHRLPLLVQVFKRNSGSEGLRFKIHAASREEADSEVHEVLEHHHGDFLRKTGGQFETHFSKLVNEGN